ncbi:hypothetical protein [Paenibacillus sp. KN14-4R]|uniref:hypothetical protein n=1 Tax=Paenibacillus sp. KN14-4R TaxID=3445773 RepID=UPI003FA06EDC
MKNIEYYNIKGFPKIHECKKIFQAVAMLDTILMPDWEYRYYSFNSFWDNNEQMASMRNGEGDHYFALFNNDGLIIKGYDSDYKVNVKSLERTVEGVPKIFNSFINEPAFIFEETTFCIWNKSDSDTWQACNEYKDEEYKLLQILLGGPEYYHFWATEYYETNLESSLVRRIFEMEPIDKFLIKHLNKDIRLSEIIDDIKEIGYPIK